MRKNFPLDPITRKFNLLDKLFFYLEEKLDLSPFFIQHLTMNVVPVPLFQKVIEGSFIVYP
jgi:hypothetical protein